MGTLREALLDSANVDGVVTSGVTPLLMEDTVWKDSKFPFTKINLLNKWRLV